MSLIIPVVPVVPVVLVNILNVLFLQFENWTFCETEWEPYNSSGNPTQCQQKRANYTDGGRKGVSEKVLEIQFNITSYGKEDICNVNCSCKNEVSTANCRFGNAYSVTYFETVSGVFDQDSSLIQKWRRSYHDITLFELIANISFFFWINHIINQGRFPSYMR